MRTIAFITARGTSQDRKCIMRLTISSSPIARCISSCSMGRLLTFRLWSIGSNPSRACEHQVRVRERWKRWKRWKRETGTETETVLLLKFHETKWFSVLLVASHCDEMTKDSLNFVAEMKKKFRFLSFRRNTLWLVFSWHHLISFSAHDFPRYPPLWELTTKQEMGSQRLSIGLVFSLSSFFLSPYFFSLVLLHLRPSSSHRIPLYPSQIGGALPARVLHAGRDAQTILGFGVQSERICFVSCNVTKREDVYAFFDLILLFLELLWLGDIYDNLAWMWTFLRWECKSTCDIIDVWEGRDSNSSSSSSLSLSLSQSAALFLNDIGAISYFPDLDASLVFLRPQVLRFSFLFSFIPLIFLVSVDDWRVCDNMCDAIIIFDLNRYIHVFFSIFIGTLKHNFVKNGILLRSECDQVRTFPFLKIITHVVFDRFGKSQIIHRICTIC